MKNRNLPLEKSRIQRLRAVGCPVPGNDEFSQAPDLVVEVRDPERNQAFDFCFSVEYIWDLRIKNTSFVPLWVEDVKGLPPWKDKNITLLVDPRISTPEAQVYRMPHDREIPYDSVLNHRIFKTELQPGHCYEGILLAYSIQTRILAHYIHGERFPMGLALLDQFGRSHQSFIQVRVDRRATMRMPDLTKKHPGTGLYGPRRAPKARGESAGENLQRQRATSNHENDYIGAVLQDKARRTGTRTEEV